MASGGKLPPEFLDKMGPPLIPWERWIKMFERYLLAIGAQEYDGERRQAMLLNCLGEAGQQTYDSLPTPETAAGETPVTSAAAEGEEVVRATPDVYKETIKLLEAEFTQPRNVSLQGLQFHLRRQKDGESLRDFLSALQTLAIPANFGSSMQDRIHKQFIIGVASTEIQERMVLDAALPFDVVIQTVMNIERSRREVREWASVATSTTSGQVTCQVTQSKESESGGRKGHSNRTSFRQPPG
ncbi:unnamed protein product [Ixodes hexagonus]